MKIAVVGAGAMGSIFGARFAAGRARHRARGRGAPARRQDQRRRRHDRPRGRRRRRPASRRRPTRPRSAPVDLVVFFTKCYHTAVGGRERRGRSSAPETVVASLQNGWGNGDVLAGAYPAEQIVVGVTYNSGLARSSRDASRIPATSRRSSGSFADGGRDAARERLAQALERRGLRGARSPRRCAPRSGRS